MSDQVCWLSTIGPGTAECFVLLMSAIWSCFYSHGFLWRHFSSRFYWHTSECVCEREGCVSCDLLCTCAVCSCEVHIWEPLCGGAFDVWLVLWRWMSVHWFEEGCLPRLHCSSVYIHGLVSSAGPLADGCWRQTAVGFILEYDGGGGPRPTHRDWPPALGDKAASEWAGSSRSLQAPPTPRTDGQPAHLSTCC